MERFVRVPDTWDAWAVRVLTVCVVLVLVACSVLINQLANVGEFMTQSRQQRSSFQAEEAARQCEMLKLLGSRPQDLTRLGC